MVMQCRFILVLQQVGRCYIASELKGVSCNVQASSARLYSLLTLLKIQQTPNVRTADSHTSALWQSAASCARQWHFGIRQRMWGAHSETHEPPSDSSNLSVVHRLGAAPINHTLVSSNVSKAAHVVVLETASFTWNTYTDRMLLYLFKPICLGIARSCCKNKLPRRLCELFGLRYAHYIFKQMTQDEFRRECQVELILVCPWTSYSAKERY